MSNAEESALALQLEIGSDLETENISFPTCLVLNCKIRQLIESENCSVRELASLITTDPLITAKLLSVANSRRASRLDPRISSIKAAIEMIGFHDTHAIVFVIAMQQFTKDQRTFRARRLANELWLASTNSSCWAFAIAEHQRICDPANAMSCSIMSTIGQYILIGYLDKYPEILADGQIMRKIALTLTPIIARKTLNILKVDSRDIPTLDDYTVEKLKPIDTLKKAVIFGDLMNFYPHPFIEDFLAIKRFELELGGRADIKQYFQNLENDVMRRKQELFHSVVEL